jgi:hypothetical protein
MAEGGEAAAAALQVAVHVRPLSAVERAERCVSCVDASQAGGTVGLVLGGAERERYTFDHVLDGASSDAAPSRARLYERCVQPLVQGLLEGFNATVLAYGQTGSGKTFTMSAGRESVVARLGADLFAAARGGATAQAQVQVSVCFFEIYLEELHDLLPDPGAGAGAGAGAPALAVREDAQGRVAVVGLRDVVVASAEELLAQLERGCSRRATGSTLMNAESSRSHAIMTVSVASERDGVLRSSKLQLVDLAGSERAKRTGAEGERMREGIEINKSLLALGNVISALGDQAKRGQFVPYRDSKLTRILQDSLGGNSRTLMIACVSPADVNYDETRNSLLYANRARNIQNRPVANTDGSGPLLVRELRVKVQQLQDQLARALERPLDASAQRHTHEATQLILRLSEKNARLEASVMALKAGLARRAAAREGEGEAQLDQLAEAADSEAEAHAEAQAEGSGPATPQKLDEALALHRDLSELDEELCAKEEAVERMEHSDAELEGLRATFAQAIAALQTELSVLAQERDDLSARLAREHEPAEASATKKLLLQKAKALEEKQAALRRQQAEHAALLRERERDAEAMAELRSDIGALKQAKVALVLAARADAQHFARFKRDTEHEVKQLERRQRAADYELRKAAQMHAAQMRVLGRRHEQAVAAQQQLKELLLRQQAGAKPKSQGLQQQQQGQGHKTKELAQWIDGQVDAVMAVQTAKRACAAAAEQRAALPQLGLPPHEAEERANQATQLILQLTASSADVAALEPSAALRWKDVHTLGHARAALSLLFAKVCRLAEDAAMAAGNLVDVGDSAEDLRIALAAAERRHSLEQAQLRRDLEDKVALCFRLRQGEAQAFQDQRVAWLQEENAVLLGQLRAEQKRSEELSALLQQPAAKKKPAPRPGPAQLKEKDYSDSEQDLWEDESEPGTSDDDDDDDDDEEWNERAERPQEEDSSGSSSGGEEEVGASGAAKDEAGEVVPKKKRGRPKGSKNKIKSKGLLKAIVDDKTGAKVFGNKAAAAAAKRTLGGASSFSSANRDSTGAASLASGVSAATVATATTAESDSGGLPRDLLARVDGFTVEELKDALALIGLPLAGRKDALKLRLLDGLRERQDKMVEGGVLLPDALPGRKLAGSKQPQPQEPAQEPVREAHVEAIDRVGETKLDSTPSGARLAALGNPAATSKSKPRRASLVACGGINGFCVDECPIDEPCGGKQLPEEHDETTSALSPTLDSVARPSAAAPAPAPGPRAATEKELASTGEAPAPKLAAASSERNIGSKALLPALQHAAPGRPAVTRPDLAHKPSAQVRAPPLVADPRALLAGAKVATAALEPAASAPRAPAGLAVSARPAAMPLDKENRPDKLAVMKRKLDEFRAKKLSDCVRPAPSLGLTARPNGSATASSGPRPPLGR